MMRASGNSPRIAMIASRPFISGIWMSISVTSGLCSRNWWTASRPLAASATTAMSGCEPMSVAIPCRTTG
jgi:hypothetical protein